MVENVDILLYSKMMSQMWPHYQAFATRVAQFHADLKKGMTGAELREKYQTTGRQFRAPRRSNIGQILERNMSFVQYMTEE